MRRHFSAKARLALRLDFQHKQPESWSCEQTLHQVASSVFSKHNAYFWKDFLAHSTHFRANRPNPQLLTVSTVALNIFQTGVEIL